MFAGEPKLNAFEAYWFIYNHPNCVEIDPAHPLVNVDEYEWNGIIGLPESKREGKSRDDPEFQRALKENAQSFYWEGQFIYNLDFDYHMVNPETRAIDDDNSKNTAMEVWLETGPAYFDNYSEQYQRNMHDTRLDCGGATFEEALIELAGLIKKYYGDYDVSME